MSICRIMGYYGSMMEKHEQKLPNNETKSSRGNALSFLKSARTGLCVLLSVLLIAFVVLPLTLRGAADVPDAVDTMNFVDMHAPSPTPMPTPDPTPFMEEPEATPEVSIPVEEPVVTEEVPTVSEAPAMTVVSMSYRRGDESEEIKLIQSRLMELEYMDFDEPTSLFGPATESAITRFQGVYEMKET